MAARSSSDSPEQGDVADPGRDLSRRSALAAFGSAALAVTSGPAFGASSFRLQPFGFLPENDEGLPFVPLGLSEIAVNRIFDEVESAYGLRFVEYLSRILLNYDPVAKRWWQAQARDIPASASEDRVRALRVEQYSSFVASVELSIYRNFGVSKKASEEMLAVLQTNKNLQTIGRKRQLALCFSFIQNNRQPTHGTLKP